MKKLLSLLSLSTLTVSLPTPLLANATLTRGKRENIMTSNSNNDYLPLKKFKFLHTTDDISSITIDSKDNVYFGAFNGAYVLKQGETTPTKINGINSRVYSVAIDKQNNVYFGNDYGAYVLKQGETTPTKINGINSRVYSVATDSKDNVYLGVDDIYSKINNGLNNGLYKLSVHSDTPIKIDGSVVWINSVSVDNKDNIYFVTNEGAYKLSAGSNTPTKINGAVGRVNFVSVDNKDNIYFATSEGAYKLSAGSNTPTKINGISEHVSSITIDKQNNVYFGAFNGAYVLKQGETTPTKINGISDSEDVSSIAIDNNNNVYLGADDWLNFTATILDWTKQQSQFNLVDSSKTKKWTQSDLIAVDDELNIDIANLNIDKVVFDNVPQPQTAKKWNINVKPETTPKDHNLQVFFTLDGKQYTSEITVSMQAKIAPPKPIVKESLDKVIKFADENNLGNILDNNNETIISAIIQKNSLQVDFTQIEIEKKDNHLVTLTAKPDSKSYQGSVLVKYNVVPSTIVDLKIDLQPTAPTTQVVKDYVGQIDTSTITSPVNTFYYANSESKITMLKPTPNSVISGVVYACDEQWNKKSRTNTIDPTNGIVLDGSQLATSNGKYVVELSDNLGHTNNIYLQIAPKQAITKYFDTDNGKQFEVWSKANGHDNIRGYSARQLNKLFAESKSWIQQASDSQFVNALVEWFKANGKLAAKEPLTKEQVIEQLKTQMLTTITIDKVDTSNYDLNKVKFELNQNEIKPNEKVNMAVLYGSKKSDSFTIQIENSNPPNNNKSGLTGWAIIGVIIGALSGLLLLGWLLKKFVITPFILEPIRKKKVEAFQRQTEKDIAQMKADEKAEQEKNK